MTVSELASACGFQPIVLVQKDKDVNGVYIGDLLSWVMGRASVNNAWITIMSNINVIAVATLTDVSCVIFSEGVVPDEQTIKVATEKGVNLLSSGTSSYDTAVKVSSVLK